jgi:GR25 family glycosyltransferase involved in LPS biosynthesis|tara:strand:- start:1448 stop:2926 length:1479 start_codon:yes stop_codon:yes gene_type:complete
MKIDKIYVINLNTDEDIIWGKLRDLNIRPTDCRITKAINGWEVVKGTEKPPFKYKAANWWKIEHNNSFFNREVTPGEIGCTLSHYDCIKDAYESGYDNIMILEEDFISTRTFPTDKMFKELDKDWSMVYLSRNAQNPSLETDASENILNTHYSYNTHAYMLSRKGMSEIIDSKLLNNVIAIDEFYSALNGKHDREDAIKVFKGTGFKQYAFKQSYVLQAPTTSKSLTLSDEMLKPKIGNNKPEWLDDKIMDESKKKVTDIKSFKSVMPERRMSEMIADKPMNEVLKTNPNELYEIEDWEAWSKKYINPLLMNKEYDLITDEPAPHVYVFPLFTEIFCKQLIALSETIDWTTDRHKFYPTTDNLLSELKMDGIYNKIINDYVRPYAIDRFKLDGTDWNELRDESFIIKYPHDKQAHLGVHHDYSNITTLVNLNPGEFEGGGTYFPKYKTNINPKQIGVATLHPGNITHKHGARPVTKGTRYVVVSFIKGAGHK